MHPSLPPAAMYRLHPFLQLAVSVDFLHLHLCAHALETRRPGSYLQAASGAPAASFPHSGPPWPQQDLVAPSPAGLTSALSC